MRLTRGVWGVVLALACLSSSALAKGKKPVPKREPACPATHAQAKGLCGAVGQKSEWLECKYPEGRCVCALKTPCAGIELPKPVEGTPITWLCEPTPPKVRADGCPGKMPGPGAACGSAGLRCSYGDCCVTTLTCEHGKWSDPYTSCPPAAPPGRY